MIHNIYETNGGSYDGSMTRDAPVSDVVLVEDFDEPKKEVYVRNIGETNIYVRLRFTEYLEVNGQPLIGGTERDNSDTWIPYFAKNYAEMSAAFRQYYQWVLDDSVISMGEWIENGAQPSNNWVYDTGDGWVLWARPLMPGEDTNLLLRYVSRVGTPQQDWFYAIQVRLMAVTQDALQSPFTDQISPMWVDNTQQKTNEFYGTIGTSVVLYAIKSVVCAPLIAGQFSFAVFDKDGVVAVSAQNDGNGNITFPELVFTEPGVYNYSIRELSTPNPGWVSDGRSYPVTVYITAEESGELVAEVDYTDGTPVFVNRLSSDICQSYRPCLPDRRCKTCGNTRCMPCVMRKKRKWCYQQ